MDISEKKLRRERITKLFFIALGIENPTEEQLKFCNAMDDSDMNRPLVISLKERGLSFGEISKKTGIKKTNLQTLYYNTNKKRLLIESTNTEN